MHSGEAEAVADLLLRANEENLATFPEDVARAYRTELLDLPGRTMSTETYVLHVAGRLVGSVAFVADAAADVHPWPPGGSVLRFLAVDPAARGRRLGRSLALVCVDQATARGARFVALHTAPTMVAARRLYEQLGFERAPEHDFDPAVHYGGGARGAEPPWGLAYLLNLDQSDV